jgi:pimeloyl-ACP methyl ester carboxylesterase
MSNDTARGANQHDVGSYAPVNGLNLYYEVHGPDTGTPLVLLHGAFSAIGSSFGQMLPDLAQTRRVIGVDLQGHGHTTDIDRPLSLEQLADDVAALLGYLNIPKADLFGYSVGAGVAVHTALRHPDLVRKMVVMSVSFNNSGFHPGLMEGMDQLKPEHLIGSPWHDEYMRLAPNPEAFPTLVEKVKQLNGSYRDLSAEEIRSIKAPTLIILGDSDIIRPEHAVEMFRLLGGGVAGDNMGLPNSRLAVLPGTTHVTAVNRGAWLVPMVTEFLDAPIVEGK